MLIVQKQQLLDRWDAVPETLREAMASEENAAALSRICDAERIGGSKERIVSRTLGYALLGFIRPEELGRELEQALGVSAAAAKSISDAIVSAILNRYKNDLASVYASSSPSAIPSRLEPFTSAARPPQTTQQPSAVPRPSFAPTSTIAPAASPAPFMIHQETAFKPVAQKGDVRTALSGEKPVGTGAASMFAGVTKPSAPSPVSARVQIGAQEEKKPTIARTEITAPRVVHYSDMRSPVSGSQFSGNNAPPAMGGVQKPTAQMSSQGSEQAVRPLDPFRTSNAPFTTAPTMPAAQPQKLPATPQTPPAPFKAPVEIQKPLAASQPSAPSGVSGVSFPPLSSQQPVRPSFAAAPTTNPQPAPRITQPSSPATGTSIDHFAMPNPTTRYPAANTPPTPPPLKPVTDLRTPTISIPKQVNFTERSLQTPPQNPPHAGTAEPPKPQQL